MSFLHFIPNFEFGATLPRFADPFNHCRNRFAERLKGQIRSFVVVRLHGSHKPWVTLQMCKKNLMEGQMSDVAYLDNAERWSKELTRLRARGAGDTENAMRSLEREYGIDYWTIWRLRYRRSALKDIGVSVYHRLKAAYEAECQRQMRKLQHEIEVTEQITGPDSNAVRAAKALVGEGS